MLSFMSMKRRMRISTGGQISIPAAIRHRWGTSTVALEDQGDRIVLEPASDDPIAASEGALAAELGTLDLVRLRREAREDERVAEARRAREPLRPADLARRCRPDRPGAGGRPHRHDRP